jgi:hypothetical protein
VYPNLDRSLSWNDFEACAKQLEELKRITNHIMKDFSAYLKGFLLDFLTQVGEI